MEVFACIILALTGILVIIAYFTSFRKSRNKSITKHPLWLGLKPNFIKIILFLQALAAIGFLVGTIGTLAQPGFDVLQTFMIFIFLFFAMVWPISVSENYVKTTCSSLVAVALSSLALLIISCVKNYPVWISIAWGFLVFNSVFSDAILWNSLYIMKHQSDPDYFTDLFRI